MFNEKYVLDKFGQLLGIDSTTGQYEQIQSFIKNEIVSCGFEYIETHKGGIIADLGGEGDTLVYTAHLDDIGLMVRRINGDGTLNVVAVGGLYPFYCVTENVRVYSSAGKVYTGTVCRAPASVHVTEDELRKTDGDFRKNVCIVLDEDVHCAEDVKKLGIDVGDYIALYPRFETSNGYIKSRFIDDKACAAILLNIMKDVSDGSLKLNRHVMLYFAVYEEIGHGTSWLPDGVRDVIALDIAPTGPDQTSDERKTSIFCKDSRFPYHLGLVNELRECAKKNNIAYVMDVFTPHYGSDGDTSIAAGHDVRHTAIGPGTANSHGYERTHIDGLKNTCELAEAYIRLQNAGK